MKGSSVTISRIKLTDVVLIKPHVFKKNANGKIVLNKNECMYMYREQENMFDILFFLRKRTESKETLTGRNLRLMFLYPFATVQLDPSFLDADTLIKSCSRSDRVAFLSGHCKYSIRAIMQILFRIRTFLCEMHGVQENWGFCRFLVVFRQMRC